MLLLVFVTGGCAPKQPPIAQSDLDQFVNRFNSLSDPRAAQNAELRGRAEQTGANPWDEISGELRPLFAPGARIIVNIEGTSEALAPEEFIRRLQAAAPASAPQQIVLDRPNYQSTPTKAGVAMKKYLLNPTQVDSLTLECNMTIERVGGRLVITQLTRTYREPTEQEHAQAQQRRSS